MSAYVCYSNLTLHGQGNINCKHTESGGKENGNDGSEILSVLRHANERS